MNSTGEEKSVEQLDVKEAFYMLQTFLPDIEEKDEEGKPIYPKLGDVYKKGRYGIKIKFDIYDYINETIRIKEKTGTVTYRGHAFELSEFWTELEDRAIEMKKWIKENNPDISPINPYGSRKRK